VQERTSRYTTSYSQLSSTTTIYHHHHHHHHYHHHHHSLGHNNPVLPHFLVCLTDRDSISKLSSVLVEATLVEANKGCLSILKAGEGRLMPESSLWRRTFSSSWPVSGDYSQHFPSFGALANFGPVFKSRSKTRLAAGTSARTYTHLPPGRVQRNETPRIAFQ